MGQIVRSLASVRLSVIAPAVRILIEFDETLHGRLNWTRCRSGSQCRTSVPPSIARDEACHSIVIVDEFGHRQRHTE